MSYETLTDFKLSDKYESDREAYKDDALVAFRDKMETLTMEVEHYVPQDMEGQEVYRSNPRVASVIDKVLDLGEYFVYEVELEGRFGNYEESFDYDFTDYAKDHLSDALGYYKEGE